MKIVAGLALGLAIGAAARWFEIPSPAPPTIEGALLVLAMTVGYAFTDRFVATCPALHTEDCGGPTGQQAGGKSTS